MADSNIISNLKVEVSELYKAIRKEYSRCFLRNSQCFNDYTSSLFKFYKNSDNTKSPLINLDSEKDEIKELKRFTKNLQRREGGDDGKYPTSDWYLIVQEIEQLLEIYTEKLRRYPSKESELDVEKIRAHAKILAKKYNESREKGQSKINLNEKYSNLQDKLNEIEGKIKKIEDKMNEIENLIYKYEEEK